MTHDLLSEYFRKRSAVYFLTGLTGWTGLFNLVNQNSYPVLVSLPEIQKKL